MDAKNYAKKRVKKYKYILDERFLGSTMFRNFEKRGYQK